MIKLTGGRKMPSQIGDYKNRPLLPWLGGVKLPAFKPGSNQDPGVGSGVDDTYKLRRKKKTISSQQTLG